jgi:3-dehydroquinate synthetase
LARPDKVADQIACYILEDEPITLTAESNRCLIRTFAPLDRFKVLAHELASDRKIMLLSDGYFKGLDEDLTSNLNFSHSLYLDKIGENVKTMAQASLVLEAMAKASLDRGDYLLVRGGGSTTDLGALCAGLYRRGLNLILAPTTLLGAVDASVGGKTAVNLAGAKNQVGLFYLPREVWIDPWVLAALPENLMNDGLTEAFKTGLLFDPELAKMVEKNLESMRAGDLPLITETVYRSAKAKAALVEEDFRDTKSIRDILNLGHTYGHAVESFYAPTLSHGRAVAMGLACCLKFSEKKLGLDPFVTEAAIRLCRLLAGGKFPERPPDADIERLLSFDKKIRGGKLKFVGLSAIGKPLLTETTAKEILDCAAQI